jgi:thymidylate synthase (FAD)
MFSAWKNAMTAAEQQYFEMLSWGATPQEARAVLPNSLKTEIVVTANMRKFRHILNLRCSKAAHPDIRNIMLILLKELNDKLPEIFEDIAQKYLGDVNV